MLHQLKAPLHFRSSWVVISRSCYVYFPFPEPNICLNTETKSKTCYLLYHVLDIESVRGLRPQVIVFHICLEFTYTVKSSIIKVQILHEFTLIMNTTCSLFVTDIINEAISSWLGVSLSRNSCTRLIPADIHLCRWEYNSIRIPYPQFEVHHIGRHYTRRAPSFSNDTDPLQTSTNNLCQWFCMHRDVGIGSISDTDNNVFPSAAVLAARKQHLQRIVSQIM